MVWKSCVRVCYDIFEFPTDRSERLNARDLTAFIIIFTIFSTLKRPVHFLIENVFTFMRHRNRQQQHQHQLTHTIERNGRISRAVERVAFILFFVIIGVIYLAVHFIILFWCKRLCCWWTGARALCLCTGMLWLCGVCVWECVWECECMWLCETCCCWSSI